MNSFLRKTYAWILTSCGHPRAPWILGVLSFTESCIFVIPPEVLLLPMSYANRVRAWFYATVTTLSSVAGALAGYLIGMLLWDQIGDTLFHYIPGFARHFETVGRQYQDNATLALLLAAFTPIPFKVFTVGAGVYADKIDLLTLLATSLLGRGSRYFIMAALIFFLGERARLVIEKRFKALTWMSALVGGGVLLWLILK